MKLDTIDKIDGVSIKTITATENEDTQEREYAYSITCYYTKMLVNTDDSQSSSTTN